MSERVAVFAPGRVNLIGEHIDYAGGLVLPMVLSRGTTVEGERGGDRVELTSTALGGTARVTLEGQLLDPSPGSAGQEGVPCSPPWAAHLAGLVAILAPERGLVGVISGDLPVAAGLSSSASLAVALARALGFSGTPLELAQAVMAAEARALGVPCGLMDPLAVAAGRAGQALLIDCTDETYAALPLPGDWCFWLIDSGVRRELAHSAYAQRRAEVEAASSAIGSLARASLADVDRIETPLLARRARHVISEIARVRGFVQCMESGDLPEAGALLDASQASLAGDFSVSTPELDACVSRVRALPGVVGARLTGAGFGGFVLALAGRGAELPGILAHAVDGADGERSDSS